MIADFMLATIPVHVAAAAEPAVHQSLPEMEGVGAASDFAELLSALGSNSRASPPATAVTSGSKLQELSDEEPASMDHGGKELPSTGKALPASVAANDTVMETGPSLETIAAGNEVEKDSLALPLLSPAKPATLTLKAKDKVGALPPHSSVEVRAVEAAKLPSAPTTLAPFLTGSTGHVAGETGVTISYDPRAQTLQPDASVPSTSDRLAIAVKRTTSEKSDHDTPTLQPGSGEIRIGVAHRDWVQVLRQELPAIAALPSREPVVDVQATEQRPLEQPQMPTAAASDPRLQPARLVSSGGIETLVRDGSQIEALIENLAATREVGRHARGEMQVRHDEFGMLTMRLASNESEIKASLVSRDPAFIAAAQQALGERIVQQVPESGATQSRLHDPASGQSGQSGSSSQSDDQATHSQASERDGRPRVFHEDPAQHLPGPQPELGHAASGQVPAGGLFA